MKYTLKIIAFLVLCFILNTVWYNYTPNEGMSQRDKVELRKAREAAIQDSLRVQKDSIIRSIVPYKKYGIDEESIYYELDNGNWLVRDRLIYKRKSKRKFWSVVKVGDAYQLRYYTGGDYYKYWTYFKKSEALAELESRLVESRITYNTIVFRINQLKK